MESEHKLHVWLTALIVVFFIGTMYLDLQHTEARFKQVAEQEERLHANYVTQCALATEHNTAWCEMRWMEVIHNPVP
jgi:hypothetical protein